MQALTYWKTVTMDKSNLIEQLFAFLDEHQIRYCLIGGQAVNAYVDPLISLDLDLVVAIDQLEQAETLLAATFNVRCSPCRLNVSLPDSNVRVQIQTDRVTLILLRAQKSKRCLVCHCRLPGSRMCCKARYGHCRTLSGVPASAIRI